jgi:hypothetical protein
MMLMGDYANSPALYLHNGFDLVFRNLLDFAGAEHLHGLGIPDPRFLH